MNKILKVGGIDVFIKYKKGMKNIYLRVADGKVKVSAPLRTPNYIVEKLVYDNIYELKKRLKNSSVVIEYIDGENFYLFGKCYSLKVQKSNKKHIEIIGDNLVMFISNKNTRAIREKYFRKFMRNLLLEQVKYFVTKYEIKMNVKANEIRLKNMKTRWGTCNITKKRIWINEQLVKYPLQCLEHVVVHELVHLLETNHTKRFYDLVEKYYPNYLESEQLLRNFSKKINN